MGNPLTSSDFRKAIEGHVKNVYESEFNDLPSQKDKIFDVMKSDNAYEDFWSVGSVPDIPEFSGKLEFLPVNPGFYYKVEPKEFAGGLQFERKLIDDKKYGILEDRAGMLGRAAKRTEVKYEVHPFAYATSTAFSFMTSEEGVALASNSHLTKSGTSTSTGFDNLGTAVLSKTSVAATRLAMRQFRDDISERIDMPNDLMLIVPDNLEEAAWEINKTPKSLDQVEGNVNFQFGKYEILVLPRLDDFDTNNWGMVSKSMMKRFLKWIDRIKDDYNSQWDFQTYTLMVAVYKRFGWLYRDWRWLYWNAAS